MEFYFIDKERVKATDFSYRNFDIIIEKCGYKREQDIHQHLYFDWNTIPSWKFKYEEFEWEEVITHFEKAIAKTESKFLLRLMNPQPLVEIYSKDLPSMIENLCYEVAHMGWEAISTDGKYIFEFSDRYQGLAISNFKIMDI
jgi:hypothetical protein